MNARPAILCPVDFSDASRAALRYARVITEHFGGRLVVLAVEDPLLTEAVDLGTGVVWDPEDTRHELARFAARALGSNPLKSAEVTYEVAVGKPAKQILHVAQENGCELIVMSTHGLTGMRKMFFGSTTERVLRETTIPVLAISATADDITSLHDVSRTVGRILVPVDLTPASIHQVQIARALAEALTVPFIATHVVEPVRSPLASKLHLPGIELERRTRAEDALGELLATVPRQLHSEALVAYGDPAEEISKIARDRRAGLILIGLHGSPTLGPRMGSVTYRVLCLTTAMVLALPPSAAVGEPGERSEARGFVHK
ncbi:MAG TPA: universal stress protein [Vicinamibacterales bacterium]|nr:universal stress protein [Vicinamibacterales bacterium]